MLEGLCLLRFYVFIKVLLQCPLLYKACPNFFFFFLVLPAYCYEPISLHPCVHMLSHVTPWTAARQSPLSMDFSRQEYWSGLPFPSPGVLIS